MKIDTLVRAGATVTVASVSKELLITCSRGVKVTANRLIRYGFGRINICEISPSIIITSDCISQNWDMIVCPGGLPGAENFKNNGKLLNFLDIDTSE